MNIVFVDIFDFCEDKLTFHDPFIQKTRLQTCNYFFLWLYMGLLNILDISFQVINALISYNLI